MQALIKGLGRNWQKATVIALLALMVQIVQTAFSIQSPQGGNCNNAKIKSINSKEIISIFNCGEIKINDNQK